MRPRGRGVWQVVVEAGTVDGKRRQQYRTVRGTKRDAELVLARMLVERGQSALPTDPTVGEIVEQYIATRPHSPTTTAYMKLAQSRIPDTLKRQPAWKVRGPDLSMVYRGLEREGLSTHSVHRVHVLLSAAFGRAVKWGVLSTNPAAAAECPAPRARAIKPPGPDDVARLLAKADLELYTMIVLAATTGMRRGEIVGLRWEDIDLLTGNVAVRRAAAYAKSAGSFIKETKTGRERVVAIGPGVVAALTDWYQHVAQVAEPQGFVFSRRLDGRDPVPVAKASRGFAALRKEAKLGPIRFHDLRHGVATQLLSSGVDVRTVAGRLGHARTSTTLDRYAAFLDTADRRAAEHMDGLFGLTPVHVRDDTSDT